MHKVKAANLQREEDLVWDKKRRWFITAQSSVSLATAKTRPSSKYHQLPCVPLSHRPPQRYLAACEGTSGLGPGCLKAGCEKSHIHYISPESKSQSVCSSFVQRPGKLVWMALPSSPPGSAYSSSAESTVTIIHHSLNCVCPDRPLRLNECLQLQKQQCRDHRSLTEVAPKPELSVYKE